MRDTRDASRIIQSQVESTYIEGFGAVAALAAALPLTCQVVDGRALRALHGLDGRRGLVDELLGLLGGSLLLLCGGRDGLCDGLLHPAGDQTFV